MDVSDIRRAGERLRYQVHRVVVGQDAALDLMLVSLLCEGHVLIEGVAISSFAIGCEHAFIYLRGEVVHVYRRLLRAVEEAYAAGHLGQDVHGSGANLDITLVIKDWQPRQLGQ